MIEEIKKLLLRRPFEPFVIVLNDGRRLEVTKRVAQVALGLTQLIYAAPGAKRSVWVKADQVVALEPAGDVSRA